MPLSPTFWSAKTKGARMYCDLQGLQNPPLIHLRKKMKCPVEMVVLNPFYTNSFLSEKNDKDKSVAFVYLKGEHNHPPPSPPQTRECALRIHGDEYDEDPTARVGVLAFIAKLRLKSLTNLPTAVRILTSVTLRKISKTRKLSSSELYGSSLIISLVADAYVPDASYFGATGATKWFLLP